MKMQLFGGIALDLSRLCIATYNYLFVMSNEMKRSQTLIFLLIIHYLLFSIYYS